MRIVDANVLIYAVNEDAERHEDASAWLDAALSGTEVIGFAWIALLAFLRLTTRAGLFSTPLTVPEAFSNVRAWVSQPPSVIVEPGARHLDTLARLLSDIGSGGNLVSDAHLAALALEHSATIVTYDNDFDRFPGVRWERPAS